MKTLNLHTDGSEFYRKGTTVEYIGFYNTTDTTILSERSPNESSVELVRIPASAVVYMTVTGNKPPDSITTFSPTPTDSDYKRGWLMRYFARQANVLMSRFSEIDEAQYNEIANGGKSLYVAVRLRWKVSGPMHDVMDNITRRIVEPGVASTNDRSIKLIEEPHPTLRNRLQNLVEFWNGASNPYFGPPQTEVKGTLRYKGK